MSKKAKDLGIASLVLSCITTVLAFAGSIMMFLDYECVVYERSYYYSYYYGKYMWDYDYVYRDHPTTGIMPFIGFLLVLVAVILLGISLKKNYKLAIGSIVLSYVSMALLGASICLWQDSYIAYDGYFVCVGGMSLLFVAAILMICYVCFAKKPISEEEMLRQQRKKSRIPKQEHNDEEFIQGLCKLKELYDAGVLTEQEYNIEKQKLFLKR